jgi:hypothetical protein
MNHAEVVLMCASLAGLFAFTSSWVVALLVGADSLPAAFSINTEPLAATGIVRVVGIVWNMMLAVLTQVVIVGRVCRGPDCSDGSASSVQPWVGMAAGRLDP